MAHFFLPLTNVKNLQLFWQQMVVVLVLCLASEVAGGVLAVYWVVPSHFSPLPENL